MYTEKCIDIYSYLFPILVCFKPSTEFATYKQVFCTTKVPITLCELVSFSAYG